MGSGGEQLHSSTLSYLSAFSGDLNSRLQGGVRKLEDTET